MKSDTNKKNMQNENQSRKWPYKNYSKALS